MTIQQCKYVLEIAKSGSFSEAAKKLFVAQSSLSTSIKQLEGELNIKMFERSSNGVYLTADGSEFVRYAQQIVDSEEFAIKRYKNETVSKKLRIVTQHYDFIADIFCSFLKDVTAECYRFAIKEIETYNVILEVETGNSDIGIIAIKDGDYDSMKRYLGKKGVSFTELLTVSPHVFVRSGHPLSSTSVLNYCDLQNFTYVSYEQGEHNNSFFTEEMLDSFNVKKNIEISDRATLMNLLLMTDSYTVGTGIMPSALNDGDIVSIALENDESYIIGYILNDSRKISEICEKFIQKLEVSTKIIKRQQETIK